MMAMFLCRIASLARRATVTAHRRGRSLSRHAAFSSASVWCKCLVQVWYFTDRWVVAGHRVAGSQGGWVVTDSSRGCALMACSSLAREGEAVPKYWTSTRRCLSARSWKASHPMVMPQPPHGLERAATLSPGHVGWQAGHMGLQAGRGVAGWVWGCRLGVGLQAGCGVTGCAARLSRTGLPWRGCGRPGRARVVGRSRQRGCTRRAAPRPSRAAPASRGSSACQRDCTAR